MAGILIRLPAVCCGTCQHWTGAREGGEYGLRLRCEDGVHPCPWRRSGSRARERRQWRGGQYKPWFGLPS